MLRGAGIEAALVPLAVTWGFAALFFALACRSIRKPRTARSHAGDRRLGERAGL